MLGATKRNLASLARFRVGSAETSQLPGDFVCGVSRGNQLQYLALALR
jgi:hypothetical protein